MLPALAFWEAPSDNEILYFITFFSKSRNATVLL